MLGVSGAVGHYREGAALPTYVLPSLPREHRELQERAAVSRVSNPSGLWSGRPPCQHLAGSAAGRDQTAATERQAVSTRGVSWLRSRDLRFLSGQRNKRPAHCHQKLASEGLCLFLKFTDLKSYFWVP